MTRIEALPQSYHFCPFQKFHDNLSITSRVIPLKDRQNNPQKHTHVGRDKNYYNLHSDAIQYS